MGRSCTVRGISAGAVAAVAIKRSGCGAAASANKAALSGVGVGELVADKTSASTVGADERIPVNDTGINADGCPGVPWREGAKAEDLNCFGIKLNSVPVRGGGLPLPMKLLRVGGTAEQIS